MVVPSTPRSEPQVTEPSREINTDVPGAARIWNYWLGGKDNYEADRMAAEAALQYYDMATFARQSRQFLNRVVRFLAGEAGIRQFLDIGTGLPTMQNTHEIAQAIAPESRIVYVDNDPIVLMHARVLLRNTTPEGVTEYVEADYHDPDLILDRARHVLDFEQPIAVMFMGVLGHAKSLEASRTVVARMVDAVPSGSYLVISHPTEEVNGTAVRQSMRQWNASGAAPITARGTEEIAAFFDGLEVLEPGVVTCSAWRPDPRHPGITDMVSEFAAVGRKP
jgi:S-adenosyl methyltransferase